MTDINLPFDQARRRPVERHKQRLQVYFYRVSRDAAPSSHDLRSKARVAEALAGLVGGDYAGELGATPPPNGLNYLVPSETLPDLASATRLGVQGAGDLFGGVVPYPFVATKVISHPLLDSDASAPAGWSAGFADQVKAAVLPGYSVFSSADARIAGVRLLAGGSVRLKDPDGVGGVGQWVVNNGAELEARLKDIGSDAAWRRGLVLERNLRQLVTHSVGQVQVGELRASYHGVQQTTRNNADIEVYGGSELVVVRGGFGALMQLPLEPDVRLAVEQARGYHHAALSAFKGMFMSRSNYDVAQGLDDSGGRLSGVLEQSWRIGGASGAEVAALQALAADASLQAVCARTVERYGGDSSVPPGAWVIFSGTDGWVGHITKYALVTAHVHA